MNVLMIGNSFSDDASRYLHGVARADGCDLTVVNLYISGCPLSKHYRNMLADSKAYEMEFNGTFTKFFVSLKEALLSREWDYISFQQGSILSFNYETYQPYLNELSAYVRKLAPKAKQVIHETWAYEQGSKKLNELAGYSEQKDMYNDIKASYARAKQDIDADMLIPSGTLFQEMLSQGMTHLHRDTFHASRGIGRYALALLWYRALTGKDISDNTFSDFDEEISKEDISLIKRCVMATPIE